MLAFLDEALTEELQTSRSWVMVDYPVVSNPDVLEKDEREEIKPYPVLLNAESVINWRVSPHPKTNKNVLTMLVVRKYEETMDPGSFHPEIREVAYVHRINPLGEYVVDKYRLDNQQGGANVVYINGVPQQDYQVSGGNGGTNASSQQGWAKVGTFDNIRANGKPLTHIPAVPLNGNIEGEEPILMPLIDREVSLYNKVSRRNHLLLGAATYTPVVHSDMTDDEFNKLVNAGLGSWIKVGSDESVSALETPSKALRDMETVIQNTILEMARLGIRMMSPEAGASGRDSGVALEIRNAGQSAILASLSTKVSAQMRKVIVWMLNWQYDKDYKVEDIEFRLTPDLNPAPIGADWLRLVTEWYMSGLIPRSVFLEIAKANDIIDSDYDDVKGQEDINQDDLIMGGLDPQSMETIIKEQANKPETLEKDDDDE